MATPANFFVAIISAKALLCLIVETKKASSDA
jgi:hypothetical protein